jgi:RNA polymerase sigma factor (sigma-70 family)
MEAKRRDCLLEQFRKGRNGDIPARDELLRRLYPAVGGFLKGRIATTPALQNSLEDLTQESMIKINNGIWSCHFSEDRALLGWCLTVARHAATDYIRSNIDRVAVLVLTDDVEALTSNVNRSRSSSSHGYPSELVGGSKFKAAVNEVLDQLDDDEHAVLWCRLVEGGSWSDVGQVLKISAGAAKQRWQRLTKRLRTELAVTPPIANE